MMQNRLKSLSEKWRKNARQLRAQTYTLYWVYRHPRTPWYAKLWAGLVVAYAFSPIDLVPDFIPVLGYLDDLVLVPLGILLALKLIPVKVMAECRERAEAGMATGKPVNWGMAAVIILVWLGLAGLGLFWLCRLAR